MALPLNGPVRRAAVYVVYDKRGVIDDYIPYQLGDLKQSLSFLLVVANGSLSEDGRKKLEPLADHVIVRENKGFDAGAWKAGLEYIGWNALSQYDELLLMNDSCFGPLFPFKTVFDEMNPRDVDFWGLNKAPPRVDRGWEPPQCGFVPAHLYSNFICLRKSVLQSPHFKAYWKALPPIKTSKDAVVRHEFLFTQYFEGRGFESGAFVADGDLYESARYPLVLMARELVANRRCPLFKRKSFTHFDELCAGSAGGATKALYEYVRDATDYDVDLIWANVLRAGNLAEIKNALHLNYVLPKDRPLRRLSARRAVALAFEFRRLEAVEEAARYIKRMPDCAHVYVATDGEGKKEAMERELAKAGLWHEVKVTEKRGISALLEVFGGGALRYEAACFAGDWGRGGAFPRKELEGVLGGGMFIENALGVFEAEGRLGVLSPPPGLEPSGDYMENEWGGAFKLTKRLLEALGVDAPLDEAKPPVAAFGPFLWFRPKALARLFEADWKVFFHGARTEAPPSLESLNQALERSVGYAAQSAGYCSGWLVSDERAPQEMTELHCSAAALRASRFWKMTKPARWAVALLKKMHCAYSRWRFRLHRDKPFPHASHP
jgi:rhamnosyltransferase